MKDIFVLLTEPHISYSKSIEMIYQNTLEGLPSEIDMASG